MCFNFRTYCIIRCYYYYDLYKEFPFRMEAFDRNAKDIRDGANKHV